MGHAVYVSFNPLLILSVATIVPVPFRYRSINEIGMVHK